MTTRPEELRNRTKQFALRILKLVRALPRTDEGRIIGKQLLRAGTGVAANYRAACRARSPAEFISRMGIVVEEADEVTLWLELIVEGEILPKSRLSALMTEAGELLAIVAASQRTARLRNRSMAR